MTSPLDAVGTVRLPGRHSLVEARARLLLALNGALPSSAARVEIDVTERVDALAWLQAQRASRRVAFIARDGSVAFAGVGAALTLPGLFDHDRVVEHLPEGARLFFASRFDAAVTPSASWEPFGASACFVPRVTFEEGTEACTLAVHLFAQAGSLEPAREAAREALSALACEVHPATALPVVVAERATPDRDGFVRMVEEALALFSATPLEKVVLARTQTLTCADVVDPISLARALRHNTRRATVFVVEVEQGTAFVGASPERLYARRDRTLETEAIAGTARRTGEAHVDEAAAHTLITSAKDQHEHGFVRAHVLERLAPLSTNVDAADAPAIHMLDRLMHLRTPVHAILRDDVDDAALVAALHPTPAVGGTPVELAREVLAHTEPFDRGLYAGPLGYITRDRAEVVVGIRSALVRGAEVTLFAGAGIVPSSNPTLEWKETEAKLATVGAQLTAPVRGEEAA